MIEKKFKFNLGGSLNTIGSGGGGGGTIAGTIQATQVAYGTATDTIGGENEFVYDQTNNLLTVEKIKSQYVYEVRNETGVTINAGTAVYAVGYHSSGKALIAPADASDPTKVCKGIVTNQITTGNNGYVCLLGEINGLNGGVGNTVFDQTITTSDIGKILYVSGTNAGRLTYDQPTGDTDFIQCIGCISEITGSNVKIQVNLSKPNELPNFVQADQVIVSAVTDESITDGDLVRYLQNGEGGTLGRIVLANASETQSRDIFLTLTTGVSGDTVNLLLNGSVNMNFGSSVASTDIGQIVYLSTTDGKATLTPPSTTGDYVIQLGTVIDASGTNRATVIFRPQFIMEIG
jgi:hypothetical protein